MSTGMTRRGKKKETNVEAGREGREAGTKNRVKKHRPAMAVWSHRYPAELRDPRFRRVYRSLQTRACFLISRCQLLFSLRKFIASRPSATRMKHVRTEQWNIVKMPPTTIISNVRWYRKWRNSRANVFSIMRLQTYRARTYCVVVFAKCSVKLFIVSAARFWIDSLIFETVGWTHRYVLSSDATFLLRHTLRNCWNSLASNKYPIKLRRAVSLSKRVLPVP